MTKVGKRKHTSPFYVTFELAIIELFPEIDFVIDILRNNCSQWGGYFRHQYNFCVILLRWMADVCSIFGTLGLDFMVFCFRRISSQRWPEVEELQFSSCLAAPAVRLIHLRAQFILVTGVLDGRGRPANDCQFGRFASSARRTVLWSPDWTEDKDLFWPRNFPDAFSLLRGTNRSICWQIRDNPLPGFNVSVRKLRTWSHQRLNFYGCKMKRDIT